MVETAKVNTLAEGMEEPWELRVFKEFEQAWHRSMNDRPALARRIAEWLPQLRINPFQTETITETWTADGQPNIISAHLPCEWRALFTVEQDRHLVALHTLQDHENYDCDHNRERVRNRVRKGLTRKAKLLELPTNEAPSTPLPEPSAMAHQPWITELELEDIDIPKPWWPIILALPTKAGGPDFSAGKLPAEVVTQLETYYTESGSLLDKIYEARLVRSSDRPLVALQLKLDPTQQAAKQALLHAKSVFMVKGGPGTGKSTVLLDSAVTVARQRQPLGGQQPILLDVPNQRPIGLMTFNWELRDRHIADAAFLAPEMKIAQRVKDLQPGTHFVISNLDKWVTRPVMVEELGYASVALEGQRELDLVRSRIQDVATTHPHHGSLLKGIEERAGIEYLLDEVNLMILGWGFGTCQEYLEASQEGRRKGRKLGFKSSECEAVWALAEAHVNHLESAKPKQWTWTTGRKTVLHALTGDGALREKYRLDLLMVDEAQDMTPVMIRLLLALVGGEHDYSRLRFASDPGQCLYGPALMWSRIHDKFTFQGKTAILKTAHRSGQALLDAAHFLRLAKDDGEEEVPKAVARRMGDKPTLVWASTHSHLELIRRWWSEKWVNRGRSPKDLAILCRDHRQAQSVRDILGIGRAAKDDPVRTLHQARGQGWPVVIIPFLAESTFPPENQRTGLLGAEAWQEAMEEERSLLYIGLTRASHQAILLADPQDRSQLLQRLDEGQWDVKTWKPAVQEVNP